MIKKKELLKKYIFKYFYSFIFSSFSIYFCEEYYNESQICLFICSVAAVLSYSIGCVIGVAQLCNKKTGPCFTAFDEAIASAFAVYCCISISHVSYSFTFIIL